MEVKPEQVAGELSALEVEAAQQAASGPAPAVPPGQEVAAQGPAESEWKEIVEPLLFGGFTVLAPAWGITQEECETLAAAYDPLLQKYFPDAPGQFGPEIAAAFVTVHILAPRLGTPRKLPKKRDDDGKRKPEKMNATEPEMYENEGQKPEADAGGEAQVSAEGIAGVDA